MIPGSILSHPIDDTDDDDFDINWHDIGGEAGSARMNKEPINADDLPGNGDEDSEDSFDWSDADPNYDPADDDWVESDFGPIKDELNPDFVRRETESVPRRPRGRYAGAAH